MNISSSSLLVLCLLFALNSHGITTLLVEGNTNVHIVYLGEKKHDDPGSVTDSHHDLLATIVGSKEKAAELIVYSYKHGFSGFAAKLSESQAREIAELPGVVRVIPNSLHKLQTTRSWDSLGLPSHSESNLLHKSSRGDGVIIGIFDTGIWPESKSFDDEELGPIPPRWKGACVSGEQFNATEHCNRKIIGARWFVDGFLAEYGRPLNASGQTEFISARDANGHGTHTASTAAGTEVSNVSYRGLAGGYARGGAPKAHVAVYKVCWNVLGGQCSSADILKAFDEAIHDGVDVLSLSIGSWVPLYSDVDERDGIATGSFHAVARGIAVVCGAGNDGPSEMTVQNSAPWILTVGANAMDRSFVSSITLGNNKTFIGQSLFAATALTRTGLLFPESKGLDPTASGVCEALALNETHATGQVVLCFTAVTRRSAVISAATAVSAAGGVGLIIARHPSGSIFPCPDNFPCVHVDYEAGTKILFYIRSTRFPLVSLSSSRTVIGKPVSPKIAHFSARGPSSIAPSILKPDVAAPGVNILAAVSPLVEAAENGYAIFSGTSMATPHVSGIVVLLRALHPTWSPAAIKSAIVTTAWRAGPSGEPIFAEGSPQKLADPFDFGSGIVNPNAATDPGLVYDMGSSDYTHYLCAMRYNNSAISHLTGLATNCPSLRPSILDVNVPSITVPSIRATPVVVKRTVTNVGALDSVYRAVVESPSGILVSVKPEVLAFSAAVEKASFEVTIASTYQMNTGYLFGSLTWSDGVHAVRIPVSVRTELLQPFDDEL